MMKRWNVKKLMALALSMMLLITAGPVWATDDAPLTRAAAAVLLDELFCLADVHTLNIPTYETTPRNMGYVASNGAIKAVNVIPAAKDCVALAESVAIETVLNAGLMMLDEDQLSFRPSEKMTVTAFFEALARGFLGPDRPKNSLAEAEALGILTVPKEAEAIMQLSDARALVDSLKQDTQITAFYVTSDLHGNYMPYQSADGFEIGSVARIQTILNESRQELGVENVLYLDGGDSPYNTTLANVTNGDVSVAALNALGLTATVLGNHDFDYSLENLLRLAGDAKYAMLSANTRYKDGHQPESAADVYPTELGDYLLVESQGKRVGIFGITDDQSAATTLYANTQDIQFDNDLQKAGEVVKALKEDEKADLIIALSHLHGKNKKLLEEQADITLSIGGGNDIAGRPTMVGDRYLINPGKHAEALTQINMNQYKGAITGFVVSQHFLTEAYGEDADIKELIEGFNAKVDAALDQTVGYMGQDLEWSAEHVRTMNSPIANMVADALLDFFKDSGAQLAIVNGGGIRAKIDKGEVTLREIASVLPFDNNMMLVETSGQTVWNALQNGISAWPKSNGKFPQVAGMCYAFKAGEPNMLLSVTLNDGTPLDLKATYKVVINSFIAGGGDEYTMFNVLDSSKEAATDVSQLVYVNKTYMRDALQMYIEKNSSKDAPLMVDEASRITIKN